MTGPHPSTPPSPPRSAPPSRPPSRPPGPLAEVVVDLAAVRHNIGRLRQLLGSGLAPGQTPPVVMVVVKADGYGHGMLQVARSARAAGADWLGVATGAEALELRAAGDVGPLLCWLAVPGTDYAPLLVADVEVAAYSVSQLEEIVHSARSAGRVARVQLKFDTGLSRGGAARDQWRPLVAAARAAEESGDVVVTGLWSHLACSDEPEHPANAAQRQAFDEACAVAREAGLTRALRHLANSAAAILTPGVRHDLVRLGISVYGFSPAPDVVSGETLGLVPVMTVRGRAVLTKQLAAGDGVSYGHTYVAEQPQKVALVPMGYGDGVPRQASSRAEVSVAGVRGRILGRVCMDQFVVSAPDAQPGDEVVLFGSGADGEPTAQDWARWCDTISYEIVTRMGGRQTRVWVNDTEESL